MDVKEFMDAANEYFTQLNNEEKYGWLAAGIGFALVVVGLALLV